MRPKCSMACISPARRSVSADCSFATALQILIDLAAAALQRTRQVIAHQQQLAPRLAA